MTTHWAGAKRCASCGECITASNLPHSCSSAYLTTRALAAQPHAVLVASVADGAAEIDRLQRLLLIARAALAAIKYIDCDMEACKLTAAQGLGESK